MYECNVECNVILIFSFENKLNSQIIAVRIYMEFQGGIYLTNCI